MSENTIRWTRDENGVVVLTLDDPAQSANTMNATSGTRWGGRRPPRGRDRRGQRRRHRLRQGDLHGRRRPQRPDPDRPRRRRRRRSPGGDDQGAPAAMGVIVGAGFLSSFVAQIFLAPIADRGRARQMVVLGLLFNLVGLLGMADRRDGVRLADRPLPDGDRSRCRHTCNPQDCDQRRSGSPRPQRRHAACGRRRRVRIGLVISALLVPHSVSRRRSWRLPSLPRCSCRWCCGSPCPRRPRRHRPRSRSICCAAADGGGSDARGGVVHDDRHVRRAVGARARRSRGERLDRQPRDHRVHAAARRSSGRTADVWRNGSVRSGSARSG